MGCVTWCHFNSDLFWSTYFPRMSLSLNKKESSSSRTTSVPPYSGRRTLSPTVACNTFPSDLSGSIRLFSTNIWSRRGNFLDACPAITLTLTAPTLLAQSSCKETSTGSPAHWTSELVSRLPSVQVLLPPLPVPLLREGTCVGMAPVGPDSSEQPLTQGRPRSGS